MYKWYILVLTGFVVTSVLSAPVCIFLVKDMKYFYSICTAICVI